jgi:hypothetical protein
MLQLLQIIFSFIGRQIRYIFSLFRRKQEPTEVYATYICACPPNFIQGEGIHIDINWTLEKCEEANMAETNARKPKPTSENLHRTTPQERIEWQPFKLPIPYEGFFD